MHCTFCGSEISSQDNFCPTCGKSLKGGSPSAAQVPPTPQVIKKKRWPYVVGVLFFLWALGKYGGSRPDPQGGVRGSEQTIPGSSWRYRDSTDPMTSEITKFASLESINKAEFKFPYSGAQHMTLTLRKSGNTDVMIGIERGQFMCNPIDECLVTMRFDDGKQEKFSVSQPSDHSTNIVFVSNVSRFIPKLKKAKKLLIQSTFYQEGDAIFTFNTEGLQWK